MYPKFGQMKWLDFTQKRSEAGAILLIVVLFTGVICVSTSWVMVRMFGNEVTRVYKIFDAEKGWKIRCRSFKTLTELGPERLEGRDFYLGDEVDSLYCLPPRIDHGAIPEPRDSLPEAVCYLMQRVFKSDVEKHSVLGLKCLKI